MQEQREENTQEIEKDSGKYNELKIQLQQKLLEKLLAFTFGFTMAASFWSFLVLTNQNIARMETPSQRNSIHWIVLM